VPQKANGVVPSPLLPQRKVLFSKHPVLINGFVPETETGTGQGLFVHLPPPFWGGEKDPFL
jgi:hypothetical protein